jgi:hypothetical protein
LKLSILLLLRSVTPRSPKTPKSVTSLLSSFTTSSTRLCSCPSEPVATSEVTSSSTVWVSTQ